MKKKLFEANVDLKIVQSSKLRDMAVLVKVQFLDCCSSLIGLAGDLNFFL